MEEKNNFIIKALKQIEYDFIIGKLSFQESVDKFCEIFNEEIKKHNNFNAAQ